MKETHLCADLLRDYPYDREHATEKILELQKSFCERFTPIEACKTNPELRLDWAVEYATCITDEMTEVRGWLPWKHWKNYDGYQLQIKELRFELIDILHFIINLGYVINVDWERYDICARLDKMVEQKEAGRILDWSTVDLRVKTTRTKRWEIEMNKRLGMLVDSVESENIRLARVSFTNLVGIYLKGMSLWGMDGETTYSYYLSKNAENIDRQKRGY